MGGSISSAFWSENAKGKKKKKYYIPVYKRKETRFNPETSTQPVNTLDIQVDKVRLHIWLYFASVALYNLLCGLNSTTLF